MAHTMRRTCFRLATWTLSGAAVAVLVMACTPHVLVGQRAAAGSPGVEGYFPGADSVQLFYREVGTGASTAVYLHGGPMNLADGGYEWDALAAGRTLIAFEQRSGGRSRPLSDSTHLRAEYFINDLEALRQHFGLERMTLIGQSWGAMLAALYTARYPTRVERLLLLSPGPPTRAFGRERTQRTNEVIGPAGSRRMAELAREMATAPDSALFAMCREQISIMFRMYLSDVTALDRMRVGYCDGGPAAIRYELGSAAHLRLGEYDLLPLLEQMQIPALVVEGAETKVPLAATRAWAAALPNSRLLLIPGANHIVYLEGDVERTTQLLLQFLDGTWPEGAEVVGR